MSTTAAPPANAVARAERAALCDLLLEIGPDAPTLCAGWTTRDLAAHLVVREGRPDAATGHRREAARRLDREGAGGCGAAPVRRPRRQVRSGPPRWSMMSIAAVDAQTNTIEFFVHHEDVRRGGERWEPRDLDAADHRRPVGAPGQGGQVLPRRSPVGVVVAPTDGPGAGTELRIKDGDRSVTLRGPVGEIVLASTAASRAGLEIEGARGRRRGVPRSADATVDPRALEASATPGSRRTGWPASARASFTSADA